MKAVTWAHSPNEEMGLLKALVDAAGRWRRGLPVSQDRGRGSASRVPAPGPAGGSGPQRERGRDPGIQQGRGRRRRGRPGRAGRTTTASSSWSGIPWQTTGRGLRGPGGALRLPGKLLRPKAAKNAHFVLPITTFAEQEGSYTNVQGRVQRFWPGVRPPGSARPGGSFWEPSWRS